MSQEEFNQKVIEHLIALGKRLESIERMLGADPRKEAEARFVDENSRLQFEQEPEWRPMSTAPDNGVIQAKIKSNGKIIKIEQNCGLWMEDGYYLYRSNVFEG